jgi:hypothetical protein
VVEKVRRCIDESAIQSIFVTWPNDDDNVACCVCCCCCTTRPNNRTTCAAAAVTVVAWTVLFRLVIAAEAAADGQRQRRLPVDLVTVLRNMICRFPPQMQR